MPRERTARGGLLVDQLVGGVQLSRLRLDGLGDAEFTWEPYRGMWSIRARGEALTRDAFGPGAYVLDHAAGADPFAGGPLATIAWRVGHLVAAFAGRWEWTFGERRTDPTQLVDFAPTASMLGELWSWIDRWATSVDGATDEQLDVVGFGTYPYGLDRELPLIAIVQWMNRETIHYLAEIALLRDLFGAEVAGTGRG